MLPLLASAGPAVAALRLFNASCPLSFGHPHKHRPAVCACHGGRREERSLLSVVKQVVPPKQLAVHALSLLLDPLVATLMFIEWRL